MPKFFIDVVHNGQLLEDEEGSELPNLEAAKNEAIDGVREIIADRVLTGRPLNGDELRIRSDTGEVLAVVPFQSAFKVA